MAGINIRKFFGIAPKVSSELLPDTSAQVARNLKLYSGDLIPHPRSVIIGDTGRDSGTKTLYGIRDPETGELAWLSWDVYVDVAVVTTERGGEFRFFYTGDGPPKFSTYDLATSGSPPYPNQSYRLGLPLPETELTTSVETFEAIEDVDTYVRDDAGVVTLVTTSPHGLKNKGLITVSGFTFLSGTYSISGSTITCTINAHGLTDVVDVPLTFPSGDADDGTYEATVTGVNTFTITHASAAVIPGNVRLNLSSFNVDAAVVTVEDDTTFTYPAVGFAKEESSDQPDIKITFGGAEAPRTYLYTWYNEFNEESIGSDPSEIIYVKESEIVTVGNIPSEFTDPNYRVDGVRLYRSAPGGYLLLATLWFPKGVTSYKRVGGVATIGFAAAHALIEDDRFHLEGMADASFNVADGVVTAVPDDHHLSYASAGSDVAETVTASGTFYYDIAQDIDNDPPIYWGLAGDYDVVDNFDPLLLTEALTSTEYEPPPEDLEGLITAQNGILAGFVGNSVYFSVPYKPHAWPSSYVITLDYEVVALALMSGAIIVLTTGYPFIISGNDPSILSVRRIDALYPCLNRSGVVTMNYGVVYPTHDGLAVLSTQLSAQLATKVLFNNDTWQTKLNPRDIVAEFFGDAYIASWSGGSFTFELVPGDQTPPFFVDYDPVFSAPWYDPVSGSMFYAVLTEPSVYEWDPLGGVPSILTWKSKTFKTPDQINLGAARVIADYPPGSLATSSWDGINAPWGDFEAAWFAAEASVLFTLWADKQPVASVQVGDKGIFRLPSGYRTDTFEVAVTADIRVRAIHLAETPYALREV